MKSHLLCVLPFMLIQPLTQSEEQAVCRLACPFYRLSFQKLQAYIQD